MSSVEDPAEVAALEAASMGRLVDGRYELEQVLGVGGMGAVYGAWDHVLDTPVAIKLVHADLQAQLGPRLLQEARAAARLRHSAIVTVRDFGHDEHDAYIVMERLQGVTLEAIIDEQGPLAAVEAVATLLPIERALEAAHAEGVVHRDIKPGNILVGRGQDDEVIVKLLDFGIADLRAAGLPVRLTQTGQVLGTPSYMSPEQAGGQPDVDERSDLWGLCATLYEALTGVLPFDGDSYNSVLRAVLLDEPHALPDHLDGDGALATIVTRGLVKDRHRRWQSARELRMALEGWLRGRGHDCDATGHRLESTPAPYIPLKWTQPGAPALLSVAPTVSSGITHRSRHRSLLAVGGVFAGLTLLLSLGAVLGGGERGSAAQPATRAAFPVATHVAVMDAVPASEPVPIGDDGVSDCAAAGQSCPPEEVVSPGESAPLENASAPARVRRASRLSRSEPARTLPPPSSHPSSLPLPAEPSF